MSGFDTFDWARASAREAVAMVAQATTGQIDSLARDYDWTLQPIPLMAAILKRKDCPLCTAVTIFLRCAPGATDNGAATADHRKLAEIVEKAINAGRFTHDPAFELDEHAKRMAAAYVTPPDGDGTGWVLDPAIVGPLLAAAPTPAASQRRRRLEGLFGSFGGLLRRRSSP